MTRISSALVASLSFALAGCGGSNEQKTADAASYRRAYAEAECRQHLQCAEGDPSVDILRASASVADCASENLPFPAEYESYLASGTVVYDPSAAAACLASFDSACAGGSLLACRDVLRGTVPVGGGCLDDIQCDSRRCTSDGFTCGVCDETIATGASCSTATGLPCANDSFCDTSDASNPVCWPYGVSRVQVVQVGGGAECDAAARCAPGFYCDAGSHCVVRLAPGTACDPYGDECALDSVCADDGQGGFVCFRAGATARTAGASCDVVGTEFIPCDAALRLSCGASGTCEPLGGTGDVGDACSRASQCTTGLCNPMSNTCAATGLANGQACNLDEQCVSAHCDTVCGPPPVCP